MRPFSRLLVLAFSVLSLAACSGGGPAGKGRALGKADAPVKLVEYASMSCGHCAQFNNTEFPQLKAKYIDTGKVHYELREILTPPNELSAAGFLLAECAGPERYFDVVDAVFQNLLTSISADPRSGLLNIARGAGMSEEAFDKCIGDPEALKALEDRVKKNSASATSTPTFWIGNTKFTGEPTAAGLSAAIDAALAKK